MNTTIDTTGSTASALKCSLTDVELAHVQFSKRVFNSASGVSPLPNPYNPSLFQLCLRDVIASADERPAKRDPEAVTDLAHRTSEQSFMSRSSISFLKEISAGTFCKARLRERVSQIGLFNQPDYAFFDAKWACRPSLVEFRAINFAPVLKAATNLRHGQTLMFESEKSGFSLRNQHGQYLLSSENKLIGWLWEAAGDPETSIRVAAFLRLLSESNYSVEKVFPYRVRCKDTVEGKRLARQFDLGRIQKLIGELTKYAKPLYIKPCIGAQGSGIIRIRHSFGKTIIETDCEDTKRRFLGQNQQSQINILDNPYAHDSTESKLFNYFSGKAETLIEEALPVAKVAGRRLEMRFILIPVVNKPYEIVGHYGKLGDGDIAGNLSIGGVGAKTIPVLESLFKEYGLTISASEFFNALCEQVVLFGERFAHLENRDSKMPLTIDLVPIWQEKRKCFEMFLMEVTPGIGGYKGLLTVEPDMAQRIKNFQH